MKSMFTYFIGVLSTQEADNFVSNLIGICTLASILLGGIIKIAYQIIKIFLTQHSKAFEKTPSKKRQVPKIIPAVQNKPSRRSEKNLQEKQLDKKSNIAKETFDDLIPLREDLIEWIKNAFFTSENNDENVYKDKVREHSKVGKLLLSKAKKCREKASTLDDFELTKALNEFTDITRSTVVYDFQCLHFHDKELQKQARIALEKAPSKIDSQYETIKSILNKTIMFKRAGSPKELQ